MESRNIRYRPLTVVPALQAAWRAVLDVVPVAAYTCDTWGRLTYCNARALAVWGRSVRLRDHGERYCGSHRLYRGDGTPLRHNECWMARALLEDRSYNGRDVLIERPDGSRVHGMAFANPLHNSAGQLIGAVNLIADLTPTQSPADNRGATTLSAMRPNTSTLAIMDIALALLTGLCWPASTFD